MTKAIPLAALVLIGCSQAPKMPSSPPRNLVSNGPSDETIVSISFDPAVVRTENKSGQATVWVPNSYQPSGEEKLTFQRLKTTPTSTGATGFSGPSIHIGGAEQDVEVFDSMIKAFVVSANRKEFPITDYGFAPFGLTNDLYFGHTFWDLDVWIMPAFIFLAPDAARSAASYRIRHSKEAALLYNEWARDQKRTIELGGMKFPWESAVSGKEVCIQKTRDQQHISGDVVFGLTQAQAMGYADSANVAKIARSVGRFYGARSILTKRGREILDVTSPNEKFEGDNDLYTNLLAEWIVGNRAWKTKPTFYLPHDDKSLLNYDNDPLRDYQQAAGLLAIYPLQAPEAEKQARTMMARFADKISPSGPAMGHAVVATIWARLGEPEKAYRAWVESWKPYTNNPNHLFSERRNAFRPYFYTGAAGAINTVIYGFAGFRIDRIPLPNAKWTKKLKSGWWLSIKPCVPKEIGTIEMKGIVVDGQRFDFSMTWNGEFSARTSDKSSP